MKYTLHTSKQAFSIIEILLGIFIFSLWLVAVYALMTSTLRVNDYNKNYIIWVNLAREQLELIRNIRDTNQLKYKPYNYIKPLSNYNSDDSNFFQTGSIYLLSHTDEWNFSIWVKKINLSNKETYKICQNTDGYYAVCEWAYNKKTPFSQYIRVDQVLEWWQVVEWALKVTSVVEWQHRWKHSFEVPMILTDFKRI